MNALVRTEILTDVPAENLEAVLADYAKTGAKVKFESASNGKYTVRAEYGVDSVYPASGLSSSFAG